jgi:hypothetical protein
MILSTNSNLSNSFFETRAFSNVYVYKMVYKTRLIGGMTTLKIVFFLYIDGKI